MVIASTCCATFAFAAGSPLAANSEPMVTPALAQPESERRVSAQLPLQTVGQATAAPLVQAKVQPDPPIDELEKARSDKARTFGQQKLKPGAYIWNENAGEARGAPKVLVSISEQQAYVYRGDRLVAVTTVSTGKAGHRTPTGQFRVTEKRAVHFSSKYNNAPMPHMQRLTDYGIALHAGHIPGRPASHGCVRLPAQFAADLFKVTRVGTQVLIRA
jgi:lipoprotein-anchoring transpeptidase ErfK/SrfK